MICPLTSVRDTIKLLHAFREPAIAGHGDQPWASEDCSEAPRKLPGNRVGWRMVPTPVPKAYRMARIPIDDLDDPRIAIYRSLKATNLTRQLGQFVVEGERLVERLLASRFPSSRCWSPIATSRSSAYRSTTRSRLTSCPTRSSTPSSVSRSTEACWRAQSGVPWPSLEEIVAGPDRPFFLAICPKLSNPENLGALARIGDVFGIDAILAGPECPDPFSRRVLRVSMGAVLRLPVHRDGSPDRRGRPAGPNDPARTVRRRRRSRRRNRSRAVRRPRRLGLVLGDEHEGHRSRSGSFGASEPSRSRCGPAPARSMSPWRPAS